MKIEEAKAALETELFTIYHIQQSIRWIFENHIADPLENRGSENKLWHGDASLMRTSLNDMQLYAETVRNLMNGLQKEIEALQIE